MIISARTLWVISDALYGSLRIANWSGSSAESARRQALDEVLSLMDQMKADIQCDPVIPSAKAKEEAVGV